MQVPDDLRKAMASLGVPNANEARAVDARQEIDLKVDHFSALALGHHAPLRPYLRQSLARRLDVALPAFKPNFFAAASVA